LNLEELEMMEVTAINTMNQIIKIQYE
jgi:hypothetical protein